MGKKIGIPASPPSAEPGAMKKHCPEHGSHRNQRKALIPVAADRGKKDVTFDTIFGQIRRMKEGRY
jgi:hypothetical protein